MPKFSDSERQEIQNKLLEEGQRLFLAHGLKKVTIDDITQAAHIAKASFYKFYEGKEYLYLDIVQNIQAYIFEQLEKLLCENKELSNKERVKQVFAKMSEYMLQYPIIALIDSSTVELISRKVSKEHLAAFYEQTVDAVEVMQRHGITFTCENEIVSYILEALYRAWINMQHQKPEVIEVATQILLDGMIHQIVLE